MKLGKQFALVSLVLVTAVPGLAQFRSGSVSPSLQLLSIPEVRKELKLSETQATQLAEVQSSVKGSMLAMVRGLKDVPQAERPKKFDLFRSELDRRLVLILDAGQRKRLHELELQRDAPRVLLKPDVGAELRLTAAQQMKLSAATREEAASVRALYLGANKTPTPAEQQEALGKIKLIQTKTDSSIYDVLTDEQKVRFKVMQGAPFKFPVRKPASITVTTPDQAAKLKPASKPVPGSKPVPAPKPVGKK